MSINRFDNIGYADNFIINMTDGAWVTYSDHLAELSRLSQQCSRYRMALQELTEACEKEFTGPLTEDGQFPCKDDESVMDGINDHSPITFGMIRRARKALADGDSK